MLIAWVVKAVLIDVVEHRFGAIVPVLGTVINLALR